MVLQSSIGSHIGTGKLNSLDLTAALVARTKFSRSGRITPRTDHGRRVDPSSAAGTPRRSHLGRLGGVVDVEGPLYVEGSIEHFLLSVFGADAVAGVGDPFTHTLTEVDAAVANKSYFTLEAAFGTGDALVANAACSRLEISGGADAIAMYKATCLLGKPTIGTRTAPTFTTTPPVPGQHNLVATIDGVTDFYVESWRYWWDHHNVQDGYNGDSRFRKNAEYHEWDCGFELTVKYDSVTGKDLWEKSWDADGATAPHETDAEENAYAVNLKNKAQVGAPERSLAWDSGAVVLDPVHPEPSGRDLMRAKITGRALDNGTIAGARALLLNSVSGTI